MTVIERGDIMDALKELPEADKQFMLGYAAGRSASKREQTDEKEKDGQQEDQGGHNGQAAATKGSC